MERKTYTYDCAKVTLQVDNVYITGFSDGGIITIEPNEDDVIPKVNVLGGVNYSENHDKTATAKIPLMSTSPMIPFLRALAREKRGFSFVMVDTNDNGENVACDECRILKVPEFNRMKEAEEQELEIFIPFFD